MFATIRVSRSRLGFPKDQGGLRARGPLAVQLRGARLAADEVAVQRTSEAAILKTKQKLFAESRTFIKRSRLSYGPERLSRRGSLLRLHSLFYSPLSEECASKSKRKTMRTNRFIHSDWPNYKDSFRTSDALALSLSSSFKTSLCLCANKMRINFDQLRLAPRFQSQAMRLQDFTSRCTLAQWCLYTLKNPILGQYPLFPFVSILGKHVFSRRRLAGA